MALWRMLRTVLHTIWRVMSWVSRVVAVLIPLVFLAVVLIFLGSSLGSQQAPLPERAALVINPMGVLVENRTPKEPLEAFLEAEAGEVLLADVIEAITLAGTDERITALILDLEQLIGPSVTQTLEIAQAINQFKASGKPVLAVADYYDQSHYLLASHADEVVLHPEGAIVLQGFGAYRNYVRQLLDNALITMNVFRVGENKSAVEPFLRDDMSASERTVVSQWLGELWQVYTESVERERGFDAGVVTAFLNDFPNRLEASDGDMAALMLEAGFVDQLLGYDQRDSWLAETVGAVNAEGDVETVDFRRYLADRDDSLSPEAGLGVVAIVPVEGELVPGDSGAGFAGSDTIVEQLQQASELDDVLAIVLRVNSPGGSVFASEVIRQKVLAIKAQGLPVVVSMGSVAASGGYYIAADADEIWAHPATITGSIGVFAAFPSVERLYEWAGITVDGVGTTALSKSLRVDTGVDDNGRRIVTSMIGNVYRDFVTLVAEGRGMEWQAVDAIAGGKVWSGSDAANNGLVDHLGGLEQAVAAAAALAGAEQWQTERVGTPLSPEQLMLEELGRNVGQVSWPAAGIVAEMATRLAQPLRVVDSLRDPRQIYIRCLECAGDL